MNQPALATSAPAPFLRRALDWWIAQVRHALPPTIFFFVGFNLILWTKRLILEEHGVEFSGFLTATLAALLVGKAVLVTDKSALYAPLRRCADDPAAAEQRSSPPRSSASAPRSPPLSRRSASSRRDNRARTISPLHTAALRADRCTNRRAQQILSALRGVPDIDRSPIAIALPFLTQS